MTNDVTATQARAALAAVARSRGHVIDEIDMPQWYWLGLAGGWIALGVVTDLRHALLTTIATVAFGAIHASVYQSVIGGRHRTGQLSVRADVAGRRAVVLVTGALIALGGVTVAGALAARADGARHPVTMASVLVAALIVFGGPQLMAVLRRRAARSEQWV
jgi:hypothetical protein